MRSTRFRALDEGRRPQNDYGAGVGRPLARSVVHTTRRERGVTAGTHRAFSSRALPLASAGGNPLYAHVTPEPEHAFSVTGLDEVAESRTSDLIRDLNESFLWRQPDLPTVICSRIVDYQRITENKKMKLRLQGAVTLQPLTPEQVETVVEDIVPYVGRTGTLTPVAHLTPVKERELLVVGVPPESRTLSVTLNPFDRLPQPLARNQHRVPVGVDHRLFIGHDRDMAFPEHQIAAPEARP